MAADISIRWRLDVVGQGAITKVLAEDRKLQRSLRDTDNAYGKMARAAQTAGSRQSSALRGVIANTTRATRATTELGGSATVASREIARLRGAEDAVAAANQRAARSADAARRANEKLAVASKRVAEQQKRTSRASGALAGGVVGSKLATGAAVTGLSFAAVIKSAATFEQSMANVQAKLFTTGKNMKTLEKLAIDLGAKTQFSAKDAAGAMEELAAQGFSVKQIMSVLPGTLSLAAASGTDLATAASIQTEALHGFGLKAKDAAHVADVLAQTANKSAVNIEDMQESIKYIAPVAHSFNQSMEDMMASVGLLGNVGIKGSQAGTTLRRALVQLVKPSQRTTNLLDDMGISMDDWSTITVKANGDLRPLPDTIGRLSKATEDLSKPERRRLIAQIFGTEALPGILTLLDKGKRKIDQISDANRDSAGAAKRAADVMRNTVKGAWDNFTGSIESATISLSKKFLPGLQDTLNKASQSLTQWVNDPQNIKAIQGLVDDLVDVVKSLGQAIQPIATQIGLMVKAFAGLPDPLKKAVIQFGLLWAILRKFKGAAIFSGAASQVGNLRTQLRGVPKDVAKAEAALTGQPGAVPAKGRGPGAKSAAGGVAGAALAIATSGGDPLTGGITGAAAGSMFGPWGALIGGVGGAFGAAIMGWIGDNGKKAGEQLGKQLAPGLSQGVKDAVVTGVLDADKATEKARKSTAGAKRPISPIDFSRGDTTSFATEQAKAEAQAARDRAAAVRKNQEAGRLVGASITQSATQGGGRRLRADFLIDQLLSSLKGRNPELQAAGARTVIEWAKGMEKKGQLPKGTADQIAKGIEGPFKAAAKILAEAGVAATTAFNQGLKRPGAVDAARQLVTRIDAQWGNLPGHAKINGQNARDILIKTGEQIRDRLPKLTGKAREAAVEDLRKINVALQNIKDSAKDDGDAIRDKLTPRLHGLKIKILDAKQAAEDLTGALRGIPNVPLKNWANMPLPDYTTGLNPPVVLDPGKKGGKKGGNGRRGGRFAGGGMVGAYLSPGEMVMHGGGTWMVPGAPTAADSVYASVPSGSAVLTGDGQARMAMGQSLAGVLRDQAPHFGSGGIVHQTLTPGQMASLAYSFGVRPKASAIKMGAIGMRESTGHSWAHNLGPRDDSWGLWQINVLPNANPKYKNWNLTDPTVNAKAMSQMFKAGGFGPWGGYPDSSYSGWLDDATRGFGKGNPIVGSASPGANSPTSINVPIHLRPSKTRAGLLADAFTQGVSAGADGMTHREYRQAARGVRGARRSPLFEAIRGALHPNTREINLPGTEASPTSATGGGGGSGGDNAGGGTVMMNGKPVAKWIAPILQWAHKHGWGGQVNSGYRTMAEQWAAARSYGLSHYPGGDPTHSNHLGKAYPSGAVDVSDYQTLARVLGPYNQSHTRKLLWAGPTIGDQVHFSANAHRRGGIVGRFQSGGLTGTRHRPRRGPVPVGRPHAQPTTVTSPLGPAVTAATNFVAGSMTALDEMLGHAAITKLDRLFQAIRKEARKGGSSKNVQRLQAILDHIDFEVGLRVGRIGLLIGQRSARVERGTARLGLMQQRFGMDPGSVTGQQQLADYLEGTAVGQRQRNLVAARRAYRLTKGRGTKTEVEAAAQQVRDAQDALDQTIVDGLTARKNSIEQARQEVLDGLQGAVDVAQHGATLAQGTLDLLDINQRIAQTADTPAGMRERAAAISSTLIPSLQELGQQLNTQLAGQLNLQDLTGARSTLELIQQNGNSIASAMGDAGDLIRQAALRTAQDMVDLTAHNSTMVDLAQQRLEIEQRLAGVYEQGGQARADFIRAQVIPALQAEVNALVAQQAVALAEGDPILARQIAEAIYGKQNEVLQAQLDAQEQIAANTKPRAFGGSLAFGFGEETLTDALVATGNGV